MLPVLRRMSLAALSLSTDVIRIDEASLKSWAETIIRESSQPVLRLELVSLLFFVIVFVFV